MDTPHPLFVSLGGVPINFRLICSRSSKKTEYLAKIEVHGGVCEKAKGPRVILVSGTLPCEQGHFRCSEHPLFSAEPAFKISWVDDCLAEADLLDIRVYLLNPSPAFARVDFFKNILDGTYLPLPVTSPSSSTTLIPASSGVEIQASITDEGSSENVATILEACRGALTGPKAVPIVDSGSRLGGTVPSSLLNTNRDQSILNYLGKVQGSTPLKPVVETAPVKSFLSQDVPTIESSFSIPAVPHCSKPKTQKERQTKLVHIIDSSGSEAGHSPLKRDSPKKPARVPEKTLQQERQNTLQSSSSSTNSDSDFFPPPAKQAVPPKKPARRVSSPDSDFDFGPPSPRPLPQNTREPYTRSEETAILRYIKASQKFSGIRSNVIWKQMDGRPGVEKRTWQSLKEHFLKAMLPKIESYDFFTKEQVKKLKTVAK